MDNDSQLTSFGRYSGDAMRVLFGARRELERLGGSEVTPAHLLLAMLSPDSGAAYTRLSASSVPLAELRALLEQEPAAAGSARAEDAPLSDATRQVLEHAIAARPDAKIGSDDLLRALLAAPGPAGEVLRRHLAP